MPGSGCIFCRIAAGEIPARKVLDTPDCVAFLDVAPLAPGHTLLVPKAHYSTLELMPAESAAAMLRHLPAVGAAVREATGAAAYNILLNSGTEAGQVVMHVHLHVIPRRADDGLGYRWHPKPLAEAEADALRARIAAGLSR